MPDAGSAAGQRLRRWHAVAPASGAGPDDVPAIVQDNSLCGPVCEHGFNGDAWKQLLSSVMMMQDSCKGKW